MIPDKVDENQNSTRTSHNRIMPKHIGSQYIHIYKDHAGREGTWVQFCGQIGIYPPGLPPHSAVVLLSKHFLQRYFLLCLKDKTNKKKMFDNWHSSNWLRQILLQITRKFTCLFLTSELAAFICL